MASVVRIVTWNCRQGFDAKASALLALKPDIAVVPESSWRPAISEPGLFASAVPHLWAGAILMKGLSVFAPTAERLERVAPQVDALGEVGLAAEAWHGAQRTSVVGVWTVPTSKGGNPYLTAARGIMERYAAVLERGEAVVAGDFNISGKTDQAGLVAFKRMMRERFGLVSAYHAFHGIEIGEEREGTLWWRGKEDAHYHCDFVFVPATWRVTAVEVGSFAEWGGNEAVARSDHAPVVVTVER